MEIKKYAYTPILGWSFSRYDTFSNCKRKYFYNYYGKHDREFSVERIEFLKGLTSIPFEIGTISHDVIEVVLKRLLKTTVPIDREKFELYLEKHILTKLDKNYFENYYGGVEKIELDQLLGKTKLCLKNFLASNRFEWIRDIAIAEKNNWVIEPPGYGESRLGEMKLYCKVDFLTPLDGKIVILDWKTGKKDEKKHPKQLVGYASWALHNIDKEAQDIEPIMVYLYPEYDEVRINVNDYDLNEYKEIIITQTQEMYGYCGNYEENIPLAKEEFPMVEDNKFCKYCNYKELCNRN